MSDEIDNSAMYALALEESNKIISGRNGLGSRTNENLVKQVARIILELKDTRQSNNQWAFKYDKMESSLAASRKEAEGCRQEIKYQIEQREITEGLLSKWAERAEAAEKEVEELRAKCLKHEGHEHCVTPCDSIRIQSENHSAWALEKEAREAAEAKVRVKQGMINLLEESVRLYAIKVRELEAKVAALEKIITRGDEAVANLSRDLGRAREALARAVEYLKGFNGKIVTDVFITNHSFIVNNYDAEQDLGNVLALLPTPPSPAEAVEPKPSDLCDCGIPRNRHDATEVNAYGCRATSAYGQHHKCPCPGFSAPDSSAGVYKDVNSPVPTESDKNVNDSSAGARSALRRME